MVCIGICEDLGRVIISKSLVFNVLGMWTPRDVFCIKKSLNPFPQTLDP